MTTGDLEYGDVNDLARTIRQAIGVGDYDRVRVTLPQFDRTDGRKVCYLPSTVEEFDALKLLPDDILKDLGLQAWDKDHWLYPVEWYDTIPEGYPVDDINDKTKAFEPGKTSNDRRFGCLAYGFKREDGES